MTHQLDHLLCGVGLFKAGEAVTYRRRAGWLLLAGVALWRCHVHHHAR